MVGFRFHLFLLGALWTAVSVCAAGLSLEERFREPQSHPGGPTVEMRLDPARGDTPESVSRRLARIRALGAGGVLVSLPPADERVWGLLAATAAECAKGRLELGLRDFWLSAEEAASTPHLQTLAWSSRVAAASELGTNLLPWVYGPGETYREVARLAVPTSEQILPSEVVDVTRDALPTGGLWRVYWFGHLDRVPALADLYQDQVVFRHVNQGLVELQGRLSKDYGTTLLWVQFGGHGASELAWPADIEEAFLKRGGVGLTRSLPALAGAPVGGPESAGRARGVLAAVLREAWRRRFAENVSDLVHESGLEAGVPVAEAPVEPEDVPLYFRRPLLAVARGAEQRSRNLRAAGAARALARRFIVGCLDARAVAETPASPLLPFPFKHELDGLFADGATRLLLAFDEAGLSDDRAFVQMRQACLYAARCQLLALQGEPVAEVLVWARQPPAALAAFGCDYAGLALAETAAVKDGRLRFGSGRSYGAVAVAPDVMGEPPAERLVRSWAAKGLPVWALGEGAAGGRAPLLRVLSGAEDLGVKPDVEWRSSDEGVEVRFWHRRTAEREIYWVMNPGVGAGVALCTFRDAGRGEPERWDPLTGEVRSLSESRREPDGRLTVPVYLAPHDSGFVVFER